MSAKTAKADYLKQPVEPFRVEPGLGAHEVLQRMAHTSFQGRNLATAHRVWRRMLEDDVVIFLGLAGALSAAGMRLIIAHLITSRAVDCVVSTGANLYHDLHETRGRRHFMGSHRVDDEDLQRHHIDRVYDTLVDEDEFIQNDQWIAHFVSTLPTRAYSSREFLYRLGGRLWEETHEDGILTAAYRSNVPLFCPAIADSSIGMGVSQGRMAVPEAGRLDVIADIAESANVVIRRRRTASVVLGGGTPKNFINQASVQAEYYSPGIPGHQYAVQIVTDVPHFGGASGSTLDEAQSWGKVATDADRVTVHADVTLALPLLVSALTTTGRDALARRQPPTFELGEPTMVLDGRPLPASGYELTES